MGCIYRLKDRSGTLRSPFWWIKYVGIDGRPQYGSSRKTDHAEAKELLKLREGKIAEGVPVTAAAGRLKFKEAADDLLTEYQNTGKRSAKELELRLRLHLLPFFGRFRMAEINTPLIRRYIAKRKADQRIVRKARTILYKDGRRDEIPPILRSPSETTINRELEVLQRTFTLAVESGRLLHTPYIPMFDERGNVRRGFLEPAQLNDVLSQLPEHYRPLVTLTYLTGWRMASEVLGLNGIRSTSTLARSGSMSARQRPARAAYSP
jgi:integrase